MIQTIYSKPHYCGGCTFLKFNTETQFYYLGNTASTAVSDYNADITVNGVTIKEVKRIAKRLDDVFGYIEYPITWGDGIDTYGDITKAGL